MLIRRFAYLVMFACVSCSRQPDIAGRWAGTGTALGATSPLTVDFVRDSDGKLRALLTMQDDGFFVDRPLERLEVSGRKIHFELPSRDGAAKFDAVLRGDTITGRAAKGKNAVEILLVRAGPVPSKSYTLTSESIRSADGTELDGDLLVPKERGAARPALVLLHGSGGHTREDLRAYADLFARNGFVALVMDKRQYGEGGQGDYSYDDLAHDAKAQIAFLKSLAQVDSTRIGVLGISEGGWVAPIVAAENRDVAFVIGLVPSGSTYADNAIYQVGLRLEAAGASAIERATYFALNARVDDFVRRLKRGAAPTLSERSALQKALDSANKRPGLRHSNLPAKVPTMDDLKAVRWKMLDYDPVPYWKIVHAPVLLVTGLLDRNADPASVRRRVAPAIANNGRAAVLEYATANHDLMISPGTGKFFFPHLPKGYPDTVVAWAKGVLSSR